MTLTRCSDFVYLSINRIRLKITRYGQVEK
ncbi:hypothetical protein V172_22780 [Citrobacter freundii RLS1]|nr:hypothetical protein V172_22780 [Citrobacter freundii RLS1]